MFFLEILAVLLRFKAGLLLAALFYLTINFLFFTQTPLTTELLDQELGVFVGLLLLFLGKNFNLGLFKFRGRTVVERIGVSKTNVLKFITVLWQRFGFDRWIVDLLGCLKGQRNRTLACRRLFAS